MTEDRYSRAVAKWLAQKLSCDPDDLSDIDFDMEEGFHYSSYTWQPGSSGLKYTRKKGPKWVRGTGLIFPLPLTVTPGRFIMECIEIMEADEKHS